MIEVIPAIDLIGGKCVRLTQGDYARQVTYSENPVEVAARFADAGIRRLHLVDLDGAKAQHIVNHRILYDIARQTSLCIDFGGGLKTDDDLRIAFENGAAMVTGGSIAVKNEETFSRWITVYGPEKIILGADARDGKIAVSGWTETVALDLIPFIQSYCDKGIRQIICTDISRDGMLQGPATNLYKQLLEHFPQLYVIASGGIASVADILALQDAGIPAVITGKALYEGKISLKELSAIAGG
jgi:phosphoribosylformimino-5-aminoimidazole carboxamide ribotide isomerase